MTENEVELIVEEKAAFHSGAELFFRIREEIVTRIWERFIEEKGSKNSVEFVKFLAELESRIFTLNSSFRVAGDSIFIFHKTLRPIIFIYKEFLKICDKLIECYDRAPLALKSRTTKDELTLRYVGIRLSLEEAEKNFSESKPHRIQKEAVTVLQDLVYLALLLFIGEANCCFSFAETSDALAIVRSHRKCRHLFKKVEAAQ